MTKTQPTISSPDLRTPTCFHCGEVCSDTHIAIGDKFFCCHGCKTVYELLESNDMCTYYDLENMPGNSPKEAGLAKKFHYLEDEDVRRQLLNFSDGEKSSATFYIPSMHCASCVWLLESLYRLTPIVLSSKVNFMKKELSLTFKESPTALRELVELLAAIGYEPQINLGTLNAQSDADDNKDLYVKIGVAGFCFANIMLLSFPEYLVGNGVVEPGIKKFFGVIMVLLALPVFFYSAQDYFRSALQGWKQKYINMDVPISIGILTLFLRSIVEIINGAGHGFMDSFAGLVFLLLIGKMFEKKTYDTLSFERDYKSYFPISVTKITAGKEQSAPLEKLAVKDRILVRNQELVPADSVLMSDNALIDYSFVTGESRHVEKKNGDIIFAGGKQVGGVIELEVIKEVSQSYLTQLWNDETFTKEQQSTITTLANSISKYFTIVVLSLAAASALFWARTSLTQGLNAFTAVLIVACPCALALSTPFTLGNTLRIFGRQKFYLKNTAVIEKLARIDTVVFDKTGTITRSHNTKAFFHPAGARSLSSVEQSAIYSLAAQSNHPVSRQVAACFAEREKMPVTNFKEIPGKGVTGEINGVEIKIGSPGFFGPDHGLDDAGRYSAVIAFDGDVVGFINVANEYRPGLAGVIEKLAKRFELKLLTGDGESEKNSLLKLFKLESSMKFKQMPIDKLNFIKNRQNAGERVLMIGDGLNDAGALKQSDVGISLSDNINAFSPASDAILEACNFHRLADFIDFSKTSMRIILASFGISFLYNFFGLGFAMSGTLSPLIAAVLMPLSSITVILFTTGMTTLFAKKRGLFS